VVRRRRLPAVQTEFGVARADASLPYTLTMISFGLAGIAMGRLSDRFGVMTPVMLGTLLLALGYVAASYAPSLGTYTLAQGALIGAGSSATFAPLIAHTSLWFVRRRGIAVAIFASGNYLAGRAMAAGRRAFHPYRRMASHIPGHRSLLRRDAGAAHAVAAGKSRRSATAQARRSPTRKLSPESLGLSPRGLQSLLIIAGLSCCVAMAMPQVHLVAYCSDLGYGPARGAEMLSLMLACGIVSRLVFGGICDRIGGLRTLLLGSVLQGTALLLFLPFNGLVSLYVISALFGLFQGGLVSTYPIIIREFFDRAEAGARVATVIMATLFGMALGGWMSGAIFDVTGSYRAAFLNGSAWNLVNVSIVAWLLRRSIRPRAFAA
jgi:MFS family permease